MRQFFLNMCAEQGKMLEETQLEKERAIRQIKELEEEVQKKDCNRETVEANLCYEINELREKLQKTQHGQAGSGGQRQNTCSSCPCCGDKQNYQFIELTNS
jgi:hypothetical protein